MFSHKSKRGSQSVLNANQPVAGPMSKPGPSRMPQNDQSRMPGAPGMLAEVAEAQFGQTVVNGAPGIPVAGVSPVSGNARKAQYVRLSFANGTGAPVTYRFGSELGAVLAGNAALPRATSGSNDVQGIYDSFEVMPVIVRQIKYRTSSDPSQFDQDFLYHLGRDVDGSAYGAAVVPFALAGNPTYQDDLLLILEAQDNGWRLGQLENGIITVLAGETVTLTLQLSVLTNR